MIPTPHPIRGFVSLVPHSDGAQHWSWVVDRYSGSGYCCGTIKRGYEPSLPAAYDRCAAAVREAREEA